MRRRCERASSRPSICALNGASAPYRIVPVENSRGAAISPARCSSLAAKIVAVSLLGSCSVVTPNASAPRWCQFCSGTIPCSPADPCACTSISPGITVAPLRSIVRAPAGTATCPWGPIALIRSSSITIVAGAITSSPFIVIARAPTSATVPFGRAVLLENPIVTPGASGSGVVGAGAPARRNANVSDSSREYSVGPSDQCSVLPSPDQWMSLPASFDTFACGIASFFGPSSTVRPVAGNGITWAWKPSCHAIHCPSGDTRNICASSLLACCCASLPSSSTLHSCTFSSLSLTKNTRSLAAPKCGASPSRPTRVDLPPLSGTA